MQPQAYLGMSQVNDGSRCVDMGGKRKEINRFEMQNNPVVSSSRVECTSQNTFFFWKKGHSSYTCPHWQTHLNKLIASLKEKRIDLPQCFLELNFQ